MSEDLMSELGAVLGSGDTLSSIAGLLGTDEASTKSAIAAALPALVGGMAANAQDPAGADSLANALVNDHDGSMLDSLDTLLSGEATGRAADGQGILNHLLGDQQGSIEDTLAGHAGVSKSLMSALLPILAPIVMGWIGRKFTQGRAGSANAAGGAGGLGDILGSILGQMGGGQMGGAGTQAGAASSGGAGGLGGGGLGDILGSILGGQPGSAAGGSGAGAGGLGDILGQVFGGR